MNNNDTSATNDSMNIDAYFESLILDAVGQADAPLHEALVRSNVYRTINDSYERALAQSVISGKLLYANGEYSMAPVKVEESVELAEPEAAECDTEEPEAAEPETVERDVEESETVELEAAAGVAEPEADEADVAEPEAVEVTAAEPEAVEAVAEEPEVVEPVAAEPDTLEPAAAAAIEPEAGESVAEEVEPVAEAAEPVAEEPGAAEPVADEPKAAEPAAPESPASTACGPISLRADSTLEQLRTNERSWPTPAAVGVSYDKKPDDGLSLMGYELPTEPVAAAAGQQEPVQAEQETAKTERPELTLPSEPQQLAISFSDGIVASKAVAEPEAAPESEPEQPTLELESPEGNVDKLECPRYLSGWDDPRCVFDSETQVAFLDEQNIKDVFSLVRELGNAEDADVRAAFEMQLRAYALPLSPQYRAQVPGLGKLSGNKKLAFDVFGNLRSIGLECCAYTDVKGPVTEPLSTIYSGDGEPLSLLNLSISLALQRKLKCNYHICNMPELLSYNWRELRTKGLTSGELHSIVSALNDWPSGNLQLGRTKQEIELARQAAMGGWYPSVNMPVGRAEAVNRLAGEAVLQLRREHLSVHEPSFRLLFCGRLANKLAMGYSEKHSANAVLTEFKNEYPAFNAAVKTFKRLNFELPQNQKDIDTANTRSTFAGVNGADSVIASADKAQSGGRLDAQAKAREGESPHESERPAAQDLTVTQALALALDQDAVRFNRWFANLPYKDRTLMGYMFIDSKPARWIDNLAISAWKIRERYDALMAARPTFDIDTFGPLFKKYKVTAEGFYGLTHTVPPAYLYMKRVYGQGAIPLAYAQVDKDLEPSVCQVVRAYLGNMPVENTYARAEKKASPAEQAVTLAPEAKSAIESVMATVPAPAPTPAPQQPAKPFTGKIENLTTKGPMSIEAWLALLPSDDADLLRWIFSDKPLMDYPHKPAGLGQLRQRRAALLSNRPHLDEDRFAPLYQRYELTEDAFCKITQAPPVAFGYLKTVKISSKFSLRLAANDRTLPQEWRERITQLNRRPAADAPRTPVGTEASNASQLEQIARNKMGNLSTRSVALRAFAESGAVKEYHNLKDLRSRYQLFLEDNKCGYKLTLALPTDDVRCLNELRGTHMFLVPRANKIRSYKVDSRFTSELRQILTLAVARNIECGTGLILRENQELCDLYDVRDDEELYEIIRSFVRPGSVPGLEMGAMPLIRLGKTDRKNQMLGVLRDAGTELSREDFAQRYADAYCVDTRTVRGNYLRDMNAYLRNGRYSYVDSDLTAEQQQFIKDMVTDDYVSLPYVEASFAAKFGAATDRLVNDRTLAPLGLEISRDLIVREGVDLRRSFTNLLMSRDSFAFGSPGFGDEVINHPEFRNAITPLLRNFTFIECNRDSFISLKRLSESTGVRRIDLGSYACSLFARTEPGVPFTVTSLRKQGFMHKLDAVVDECGFDNSFYDSIVLYGLAQEQIRRTRFSGVYMFCRKEGPFSSGDAVEYVVRQKGPIEVGDLIDVFQDEYGVAITAPDISRAVQDKGLFYNEDLDMVMLNKRMNAVYLQRLLSNNNQ